MRVLKLPVRVEVEAPGAVQAADRAVGAAGVVADELKRSRHTVVLVGFAIAFALLALAAALEATTQRKGA